MALVRLKSGVKVRALSPQAVLASVVAQALYAEKGYEFVITSISEGIHSRASRHYEGDAFDCRSHVIPEAQRESFAATLQDRLGDDFDVILESDHIHVEWQPQGQLREVKRS